MPEESPVQQALRLLAAQKAQQQRPPLAMLQAPLEGGIQGLLGLLGIGDDASQANRFGAMLAAGLPLAAGAKGLKAAVAERPGIRAYHGSPHDFERFSTSKIGTGEGAQAYGHGLYFAEKEGTAKAYRDALAPQAVLVDGKRIGPINSENARDMAIADLAVGRENVETIKRGFTPQFAAEYEQAVNTYRGRVTRENPGKVYEVNIKADPAEMLDWDKPVAAQTDAVQARLRTVLDGRYGAGTFDVWAKEGADVRDLMGHFDDLSESEMSAALHGAGIPGVKYLDQGSRATGRGTSNYVMFNDNLIDILRKYGVAIAATLGAGSQFGQEPQQ